MKLLTHAVLVSTLFLPTSIIAEVIGRDQRAQEEVMNDSHIHPFESFEDARNKQSENEKEKMIQKEEKFSEDPFIEDYGNGNTTNPRETRERE